MLLPEPNPDRGSKKARWLRNRTPGLTDVIIGAETLSGTLRNQAPAYATHAWIANKL